MKTLEKGTIVYNRNGAKGKFLTEVDGEYFVQPEIEVQGWDGDSYFEWGDTVIWNEVFPKAPTEVLDAEIAQREKEIEELTNKARRIHSKVTEVETLMKAQKDKFTRYEKLKHLEDFIDGKVTHLVRLFQHYNSRYNKVLIQEFKDGISRKDENDYYTRDKLKFVTLFGDTKGELNYNISNYGDTSNSEMVIPCKSREEAIEEVQKIVNQISKELEGGNKDTLRSDFFESVAHLGVTIPNNIIEYFAEQKEQQRLNRLEAAKGALEKAKKALADLEAGIPDNSAPYLKKV